MQQETKKSYSSDVVNFQTPIPVCEYMASLIPARCKTVLEPTKGAGNLISCLSKFEVTAPDDYFSLEKCFLFDAIVMNPPFTPMSLGYKILGECLERSDIIIALMPWLTFINGKKRTETLQSFGIKSITHLHRNVFNGSRVQCCILELNRGYKGSIELRIFNSSAVADPLVKAAGSRQ